MAAGMLVPEPDMSQTLLGFSEDDRKLLITLGVQIQHVQEEVHSVREDLREVQGRLRLLESERVTINQLEEFRKLVAGLPCGTQGTMLVRIQADIESLRRDKSDREELSTFPL